MPQSIRAGSHRYCYSGVFIYLSSLLAQGARVGGEASFTKLNIHLSRTLVSTVMASAAA